MKKGLVLEGGGVKGAYQVGAYYAFKDCNIKLDGFVGTSIGSFNAAMLASNKSLELLDFWYNVNPGKLFGFDQRLIDIFNEEKLSIDSLKGTIRTVQGLISNVGIDNSRMFNKINELLSLDDLLRSDKDFGLVTVKVKGYKPIYKYKEDIKSQQEFAEYLIASCYLPLVFRQRKIIDNNYYIDGGFYDNSPTKLLSDKGYDVLYVIGIKGIGFRKKDNSNTKIINIKPSRPNGGILELNTDIIRDNIKMGYYDTLRVLRNYDGYKYCFKRKNDRYYDFLIRKVPSRLVQRVKSFFGVYTNKEAVIKAVEYLLDKENITYYDIYDSYKVIKKYKNRNSSNFVYKFISYIKFL